MDRQGTGTKTDWHGTVLALSSWVSVQQSIRKVLVLLHQICHLRRTCLSEWPKFLKVLEVQKKDRKPWHFWLLGPGHMQPACFSWINRKWSKEDWLESEKCHEVCLDDVDDAFAKTAQWNVITGTNYSPLQFCSHQWEENKPVVELLLGIKLYFVKFMKNFDHLKRSKVPDTTMLKKLKEATNDPVMIAKLRFLSAVAVVHSFLMRFKLMNPWYLSWHIRLVRSLSSSTDGASSTLI